MLHRSRRALAGFTDGIGRRLVGERWRADLEAAPEGEPVWLRQEADAGSRIGRTLAIKRANRWFVVRQDGTPVESVAAAWAPLGGRAAPAAARSPNLFVLGAGKCGTSSLHAYLGQHPDVHACRVKEPTFFCSYFRVVDDPRRYFALLESGLRYRMESSHAYLTNPDTAAILKTLFPDAKFVVTLRHPRARAISLYRHMRRLRSASDRKPYEEIPDFLSALRAEDDRFSSQAFFANCRQYFWNFLYVRSSLYDEQLRRYLALFDRRQFHVVTLAELAADPAATVKAIARFLGIDPDPVDRFVFEPKNVARGRREEIPAECEDRLQEAFDGLTDRVDAIVGRRLDWSA